MDKNTKAKIESAFLTAVIGALILLLLFLVTFEAPREQEEEGVEVVFGNSDNGGGSEPQAVPMPAVPVTQAPPPTPQAPTQNDMMVQEDEESLALAKQREEEARKRAEQEEMIRKQREEEARIEAERIAREQQLAEERARQAAIEQEKRDKANAAMSGLFGNNQQGAQGSGTTQGASQQGSQNPVGHGTVGGNSWSLAGRNIKTLPKPSTQFNQEGKVVVNIQVNNEGKVISATVGEGTTVSDYQTRQVALEAARKAEFSPSENKIQVGTITYTFKLN